MQRRRSLLLESLKDELVETYRCRREDMPWLEFANEHAEEDQRVWWRGGMRQNDLSCLQGLARHRNYQLRQASEGTVGLIKVNWCNAPLMVWTEPPTQPSPERCPLFGPIL